MKRPRKAALKKADDPALEYPDRLVELEAEIRSYPSRAEAERNLKSVRDAKDVAVGQEKIVQFSYNGKVYAMGHSDLTYADSNHARGVRHIGFHAQGNVVLYIEGDFEDQQFGSNFHFHTREIYTQGEWEADFVALSEELRLHAAKRREAFRRKRNKDQTRFGQGTTRI